MLLQGLPMTPWVLRAVVTSPWLVSVFSARQYLVGCVSSASKLPAAQSGLLAQAPGPLHPDHPGGWERGHR